MTRDMGTNDAAWGTWSYGDVAVRREILKDHLWTVIPTYVVHDSSDLLVTFLAPGTTLGFPEFPHPRWEHPWKAAGHTHWTGHGKLMMHRPGDAYSVDVFWKGEERSHRGWYLNLQAPLVRDATGYDTLDHELDYWVPACGGWGVKDDELFEQRLAEERYSPELGEEVRRTGVEIESMLTTGSTWWDESWAAWTPPGHWGPLQAGRPPSPAG